jgi:hypothetical protein
MITLSFLTKKKTPIKTKAKKILHLSGQPFMNQLVIRANQGPETPSAFSLSPSVLWHPSLLSVPEIEKRSSQCPSLLSENIHPKTVS